MGKTLAEKIIGRAVGHEVCAGDYVIVAIDKIYIHDGNGPLAVDQMARTGITHVAKPDRTFVFLDHSAPSPDRGISNSQKRLRDFAVQTGCHLFDVGDGICHTVMFFDHIAPGDIVIASDSHTTTGGALGAFATGMGSTDSGIAMALGETWIKVPEALRFELSGRFPAGVCGKDLILHIIGMIGSDGATYKSMEFVGDGLKEIEIYERVPIANMAVEAGAKVGLFPSDSVTKHFLDSRGRGDQWKEIAADDDAQYETTYPINLNDLEPMISYPHFVDNTCPVTHKKVKDVKIDQGFLGSCTGGTLEDLRMAAQIIENNGGKLASGVRLIVNPGSREIYEKAMEAGILMTLSRAGATINTAGCGVCNGSHQGVLADGEVAIGSHNRNFKGRFGNPNAEVYLGSPATVAASVVTGKITDPREVL